MNDAPAISVQPDGVDVQTVSDNVEEIYPGIWRRRLRLNVTGSVPVVPGRFQWEVSAADRSSSRAVLKVTGESTPRLTATPARIEVVRSREASSTIERSVTIDLVGNRLPGDAGLAVRDPADSVIEVGLQAEAPTSWIATVRLDVEQVAVPWVGEVELRMEPAGETVTIPIVVVE